MERVVVITGAAGGLGEALVDEFNAQQWRVAAAHHSRTARKETETILPMRLDVTDRDQVHEVIQRVHKRWGRIDALINNAGLTADCLSWQIDERDWDHVLEVNLKGAFLCSQAVLRLMVGQRDGHIINIASFAGRQGNPGQAAYAAAKAGLFGLTESLAREVGSRNVRVNAVLPGLLRTPMTAKLTADQLNQLTEANTLRRLNSVGEVARFVGFLATTQNISGQLFQLDSRIGRWT